MRGRIGGWLKGFFSRDKIAENLLWAGVLAVFGQGWSYATADSTMTLRDITEWGLGISLALAGLWVLFSLAQFIRNPKIVFSGSLRRRTPDYARWDKRDQFYLYEVACLWVEEEPTSRTGEMSSLAKAEFGKLRIAMEEQKLELRGSIEEILDVSAHILKIDPYLGDHEPSYDKYFRIQKAIENVCGNDIRISKIPLPKHAPIIIIV